MRGRTGSGAADCASSISWSTSGDIAGSKPAERSFGRPFTRISRWDLTDMRDLDRTGPVTLYKQIADQLREQISGPAPAGRSPSQRDAAPELLPRIQGHRPPCPQGVARRWNGAHAHRARHLRCAPGSATHLKQT